MEYMEYRDIVTIFILFTFALTAGLRVAERGVAHTMGIDPTPQSFSFLLDSTQKYNIVLMGKNIKLQKVLKIGDFYANRKKIKLFISGKNFSINPILNIGLSLKSFVKLDKRQIKLYN